MPLLDHTTSLCNVLRRSPPRREDPSMALARLRPPPVSLLKQFQKLSVDRRQGVNDGLRPLEVFSLPLKAPARRWVRCNVPQIADLIGELHERAFPTHVRRVL